MRRAPWYLVAAVMLLAVVGRVGATAHAASLGGLRSASLYAQRYHVGSITDTFDDPDGTDLASTTDAWGDPWTVDGGTFRTDGGHATASTGGLVTATVPLRYGPSANAEVGGDIHSSGSSSFGLLMHARPGGRPATAVLYSNGGAGTVRLVRVDADGSMVEWAQATQTGGGNAVRFLRVSYLDGVYTVTVDGERVLGYPAPAGARAGIEANTAVGIAAASDTKSYFDNLQAYTR